jgi:flagellar biosynthetic protein FliR
MTTIGSETVLYTFLLFCRIGGCLMFMPGFSSARMPMQARLFLSMAATLALAPLLLPAIKAAMPAFDPVAGLDLLLSETTKGVLIGIMARYFFLALDFSATLAASASGLAGVPGVPIEGSEALPAFGGLLSTAAIALFFITDMHWEVLRAIADSYRALPVSGSVPVQFAMANVAEALSKSFVLALQICGPFVIYSIAINVLFGIANKLTPQVPVYFVSLPFVILGGLIVLYFVVADFLRIFIQAFENWLVTG